MKRQVFLLLNIIIPIVIGTLIYYFMDPNVILLQAIHKKLDPFLSIHPIFSSEFLDSLPCKFIRGYLLDMLWAYALVFGLYFFIGNSSTRVMHIFICAAIFSIGMEVLQRSSVLLGTFDLWDILLEILAEIIAIIIINRSKEEKNEKI